MARIVKSSDEDEISIPSCLMEELKLRDGDAVKAIVEGESLRLVRLDKFLSLRGALAGDEEFDRAMELIDQSWNAWTSPTSV